MASPAFAATPYTTEVECPDGSMQTVTRTMSYSTFGQRIDGKPHGNWVFPFPLDICEDGFILYQPLDQFEPDELARARVVVATPEYQAELAEGPTYLALYHLLREMQPADESRLVFILLQASWQVDEDRERYEAIQRMFVANATPFAERIGPENEIYDAIMEKIVNAHRILGEFDAAATLLASLRETSAASSNETSPPEYYDYLESLITAQNREIDPPRPDEEDEAE